jgi:HD-like signal output (HDOD) protein
MLNTATSFGTTPAATFEDGQPITMDELLKRAKHLTPMPSAVIKLLDVMGDPRCSAERVTKIIERDQAIAAAAVRLSNSAMHRARSPITSLQMAVTRVGLSGIRDLVVAASVLRTPTRSIAVVERARKRMFATGCYARVIGECVPRISADTCFMSAMLLDVGRFLIGLAAPEGYTQVVNAAGLKSEEIARAERSWLGFDHGDIGHALAVGWGFPDTLAKLIYWHNNWFGAEDDLSPEESWYLAAGILADDMVAANEGGTPYDADAIRQHPVYTALRIPEEHLSTLAARCDSTLEQMGSVFDL